jgi:hypothetical protein
MRTISSNSLYEPSETAQRLYGAVVGHMDEEGFVGPISSLAATAEAMEFCGDLKGVTRTMAELIRASLVLPDDDRYGWLVRLPARIAPGH